MSDPTQAQDVTAIFNAAYTQMFPTIRPMRATVDPRSQLMDHPLESGAKVTDHKIFQPVEITLMMLLGDGEYKSMYAQVKAAYRSSELLIVQTKVDTFPNMTISEMPHEETTDQWDAVTMNLKLREVQIVQAQFQALPPKKVKRNSDASTKDRGEQTATKSSKLNNVFGGFFK